MAKLDEQSLTALKIAYCYMPQAIEVNEFDFAGRVEKRWLISKRYAKCYYLMMLTRMRCRTK